MDAQKGVKNCVGKELGKRMENGCPGNPQMEPKSNQGHPKELPGDVLEVFRIGCRKNSNFQIP